jgi:hypothetical protein
VVQDALSQLSSRPNVAFMFYSGRQQWIEAVDLLPPDTILLATGASNIQSNIAGDVSNEGSSKRNDLALTLGSFAEAVFVPFLLNENVPVAEALAELQATLEQAAPGTQIHFYVCFTRIDGRKGHTLANKAP